MVLALVDADADVDDGVEQEEQEELEARGRGLPRTYSNAAEWRGCSRAREQLC